jgi:hypothetical protein
MYYIQDDLGNSLGSCSKDQRFRGGAWQFCDSVTLAAGRKGVVVLTNQYNAMRYICADAVRFVRVAKDRYDITDEPGIDWGDAGSFDVASLSTSTSSQTDIRSFSITTPNAPGYIEVKAAGYTALTTANKWVRLTISQYSDGATYAALRYHENPTGSTANYENRKDFYMQEVFEPISPNTTYTFYLKGSRETGATGTIYFDEFIGKFYSTKY